MAPISYDRQAIEELEERTWYESYFLEQVYLQELEQIEEPGPYDTLIYPANYPKWDGDASLSLTDYGIIIYMNGGWTRDRSFLDTGAPLIFISAFKILDMIFEWVLIKNNYIHPDKFVGFEEKIKKIKNNISSILFPDIIESNPWLRDELIVLYEQTNPLRGTIIHDKAFHISSDGLHVKSTKNGIIGPEKAFSKSNLYNLSFILILLLRHLRGTWCLDEFQLKRIGWAFDELACAFGLPAKGRLKPGHISARLYAFDSDTISIDLKKLRSDINRLMPSMDVWFDIRLILVSSDASKARAIYINWDRLKKANSHLVLTNPELSSFVEVKLPDKVMNEISFRMTLNRII